MEVGDVQRTRPAHGVPAALNPWTRPRRCGPIVAERDDHAALLTAVFQKPDRRRDQVPWAGPAVCSGKREAGIDAWTFVVSDDGIGVDEQYSEQVFVILDRRRVSPSLSPPAASDGGSLRRSAWSGRVGPGHARRGGSGLRTACSPRPEPRW